MKQTEVHYDEIPDTWVFVKVVPKDLTNKEHYPLKVLCGYYGGYTGGDSWRLSSGNQEVVDHGDYLIATQQSGTVYKLWKSNQKLSGTTANILNSTNRRAVDYQLEIVTL